MVWELSDGADGKLKDDIDIAGKAARKFAQGRIDAIDAASDVRRIALENMLGRLKPLHDAIDAAQASGTFAQFVADIRGVTAADITAELNSMETELDDLATWCRQNRTTHGPTGGTVLEERNAWGNDTPLYLSTAEKNNFRTELAAFVATLNQ